MPHPANKPAGWILQRTIGTQPKKPDRIVPKRFSAMPNHAARQTGRKILARIGTAISQQGYVLSTGKVGRKDRRYETSGLLVSGQIETP